jgi:TM2 domain-containing membrane protein YozV
MTLLKPFTGKILIAFFFLTNSISLHHVAAEGMSFLLPEYSKDRALIMAEQFIESGCHDEAITEVKRFLFFHPGQRESIYAHNRIAKLYILLQDWENALHHLTLAIRMSGDENEKSMLRLERAKLFLAAGDLGMAEKELLVLFDPTTMVPVRKQAVFFLAVCYIYNGRWKNAQDLLHEYFETHTSFSDNEKTDVIALLRKAEKEGEKSPLLASLLSAIIPGSGQIYAGDFGNGLHAFLINAGTGFLLTLTIIEGRYADASMIFLFLFNRFYTGNIYHAERLSREYNMRKRKEHAQAILNKLSGQE